MTLSVSLFKNSEANGLLIGDTKAGLDIQAMDKPMTTKTNSNMFFAFVDELKTFFVTFNAFLKQMEQLY
jgi:hypothetical protein